MIKVNIKPLSINRAWIGKQRPTAEFKSFKQSLMWQLPPCQMPEGNKAIFLEFGLSNKLADYDNLIKTVQDCIAEKYGFNDREIYQAVINKTDVTKGKEYIKFSVTEKLCGKCWLELNQVAKCEC